MFHSRETIRRSFVQIYTRNLNCRVSLVYLEEWSTADRIELPGDIRQALFNLLQYLTADEMYEQTKDAAVFLT